MLNFFFFKSNQKLKQKKKFLCGSLQVKPICLKKLGVSLKHYKQFLTKKSISVYNEKVRKKLIKSISNIIVNQLNKNCFFIKIKNFQFFFKNSIYIISQAKFRTLIYRFLTIEGKKYRLEFLQNFLIYNKIIKHIFFLLKKKKNLFFSSLKFIVNNTILKTRVTHHNLFLKLKKKINYDRILLCSKFYQGNFKSKDIFKFLFFFVKRKKDILFEIQKVCRLFVAFEFTKECAHSFICYMRLFNINYLPKKFIIEIENSLIRRDLKIITTIFTLLACLSHRVKRIYFFALARVSFFDNRELLEFFILGALIRNINRFDFIQFMYILRKSILKLNYFFLSFTKNLKHISKLRCFIFFNFFF